MLNVDVGQANQLTWNRIFAEVHGAHAATVKLGSVLTPPVIAAAAVLVATTSWFTLCAVVPRDDVSHEGAGWVLLRMFTPAVCFLFALASALFAELPLLAPADVTKACDELKDAVRSLRVQHSDTQAASRLSSPQVLIRIEGICRYLLRRIDIDFLPLILQS